MFAGLCLIVLGMLIVPKANAQPADDGFFIITSPATLQLTAEPGTTAATEIRVKNNGTQPERIKVHLMKFDADQTGGQAVLKEREDGDDYFDWVTISPQSFDAPVNEWVTVKISVSLPATAGLGYYYAVAFSQDDARVPEAQSTQVIGSSATLMLLTVPSPNEHRALEISEFESKQHWYEFLPGTFKVTVKNTGNIHASPVGNIFINRGGKTIATIDVNSAGGNILPASSRSFSADWSDGFPAYATKMADGEAVTDAAGQPVRSLNWDFSKLSSLRIGKYTAHILLVYDDQGRDVPLQATVTFWVMPWRLLGLALVLLLLIGVGIWTLTRGTWRKIYARIKKPGHFRGKTPPHS